MDSAYQVQEANHNRRTAGCTTSWPLSYLLTLDSASDVGNEQKTLWQGMIKRSCLIVFFINAGVPMLQYPKAATTCNNSNNNNDSNK